MNLLAIIPARGGSKGIPRKNIRPIAGKPLIAHTIECAFNAKYIDRVVVSTDDSEIAAVSKKYGAEVVLRPDEISGDFAPSEAALLHTLDYLKENENYLPEIIVFLQCTSPLTSPEDIEGTVDMLIYGDADSALAVTPFHHFLWKQESGGNATGINHNESIRLMRQEKDLQYLETGAVYAMRTEGFIKAKHRFFGKTVMHVTPVERCVEIDEPIDFKVAETLMREQQKQEKSELIPERIDALILDFDGVFTDNRVLVFDDGKEAVFCNRSDGMGIERLKSLNIPVLVISKEENPVVAARCRKLNIPCKQNIQRKIEILNDWLKNENIDASNVVYIGNDVNDLECLQAVGCGVVVQDAHPSVKNAANIILENKGGCGAIRELCELILQRSA